MIKTNKIKKSKIITFDADSGEYSNLSFQYINDEADENYGSFIDWVNGGHTSPVFAGTGTILEREEYDTEFLNRAVTQTLEEYTLHRLIQKLNTHLNEFNYRYENTENIGLPYLEKPSSDELDLFIKEAILNTVGVKEITEFASRSAAGDADEFGKNRVTYFAEFKIKTETGEEIWQSIEI